MSDGKMEYRSVRTPQEALIAIQDAISALEYRAQLTNPQAQTVNDVTKSYDEVISEFSSYHRKNESYPYRSIQSYVRYDSVKKETILTTNLKDHEIMKRYDLIKDVITKFKQVYTERHDENISAIENNKRTIDRIVEFMEAVGVSKESYRSVKSGRSTKSVKGLADWYLDICNKIKTNDGFKDAISRCDNDLKQLEEYHKAYLTYKSNLESEQKARKQFSEDFKLMTKLSAKYDRDTDDFHGVIHAICEQSPFLQVYYAWKTFDYYDDDADSIRFHLHKIKDLNKEVYDDIVDACDEYDSNGDRDCIIGADWLAVSKQVPDDLFMEFKSVNDINRSDFNKRFKEI